MIIKDSIRESSIAQGDLIFIFHKTKPFKTGWWRKVREGSSENKVIYYILEKPMHKDFNIELAGIKSHVEKGLCVMTQMSLKNGVEMDKYEILADIRGVYSVYLSTKGYDLNDVLADTKISMTELKENVFITERFKKLAELYKPKQKKLSDLESLAENLI